ncbi:selenoneine synthase SenA [Azohydromonas aeria]|uniref:selenoneine synthase SenA n=1 Tax=Azohydromonas aeria TaxID=2590212 RepID=UPI0012F97B48|nr:selenoneine synthase SenA [Azohydromonas aeria]
MDPDADPGECLRRAGPDALAAALQASRRDTLATFAVFEAALPDLRAAPPGHPDLNPPLWELGHVGWFQEFWIARHPGRGRGAAADPQAPRAAPLRAEADALYDSGRVPQAARAALPLPDAAATRAELADQLVACLRLLREAAPDDDGLYFFRLALAHEDMHHEAALWQAQLLGLPVADARWQPAPLAGARTPLRVEAGTWRLGMAPGDGFAFDNELPAHAVALETFDIDRRAVSWDEFIPFVEAGGYREPRWWDEAGRRWLLQARPEAPQHLHLDAGRWWHRQWDAWRPLDGRLAACHLNRHEARAWCAWAGRRLPSEAEWEAAALAHPADFAFGAVWEWTDSEFLPYPGFVPHPYRDYSQPWFGHRAVLRGGSFGAQRRLHHARYRNFFEASRRDVFSGFRSCAR